MFDFINAQIVKAQAAVAARQEGQAMVEYGLVLVLVSVVAVTALGVIGTNVNTGFGLIGDALGDALPLP